MIQIVFNGSALEIEPGQSLAGLLGSLPDLPDKYAVALNEDFVPRSAYANTPVEAGDQLELLVPMQGG